MTAQEKDASARGRSQHETQAERFNRIYRTIREQISLLEYPPGAVSAADT